AELKAAVPELLGEHHLTYWWSFVCQHQRPGTDIHADQSDISLNFWITPDSANLAPEGGGLEMWNVAAPPDWTFNDYNADRYRIRLHLSKIGARQKSYSYARIAGCCSRACCSTKPRASASPRASRTDAATSPCCSDAAR